MPLISSKEVGLSFGIELEIIVCHKQETTGFDDGRTHVSKEEEAVMPPALETPFPQYRTEWFGGDDNTHEWLYEEIGKIITTIPGAKFRDGREGSISIGPGPDLFPSVYLMDGTAWEAKPDVSVNDNRVHAAPGFVATGVEIVSPALWDCPEAHRHVHEVITALSSVLRWRVNPKTGFHVHVGAGAREVVDFRSGRLEWKLNKFDFQPLQRAAALIWAADHFLSYAHPPERQLNLYALSISVASQLALGEEGLRFAIPEYPDESDIEWHQIAERFPNLTLPPRPPFNPDAPSSKLRSELHPESLLPSVRPTQIPEHAEQRFRPYMPGLFAAHDLEKFQSKLKHGGITMEKGIAYIMRPESRHKIARLLSRTNNESNRLNYNFINYTDDDYKGFQTIEFREATGTLDPTTIAAWSSVTLALFRFATVADDAHFWHVIWNLIDSHKLGLLGEPHSYDMISLMIDVGAAAEAAFFERSLREMGDKHWFTSTTNTRTVSAHSSLDGSPPQNRMIHWNINEPEPAPQLPQWSPIPLGTPPNRPSTQPSSPSRSSFFNRSPDRRSAAAVAVGSVLPSLRPGRDQERRSSQSQFQPFNNNNNTDRFPLEDIGWDLQDFQFDGENEADGENEVDEDISLPILRPTVYVQPLRIRRPNPPAPHPELPGFEEVPLNEILSEEPNDTQEGFGQAVTYAKKQWKRTATTGATQAEKLDELWDLMGL